MTSATTWLAATRPRTLPAVIAPVAVGVAVAGVTGGLVVWRCVLAFVVGLSMQIGTNFANDYSDGIHGTDEKRVGPVRLVAGGLAAPRTVRMAAMATFVVGMIAGVILAIATSPWVIPVGAACVAAGWLYTGGPRPYGYAGFGELFVFVFFGFVAVIGTVYVSSGDFPALGFVASVPLGLCSVALLVVNNLRDIPTDTASSKKTLAVRLGAPRTRQLYVGCITAAIAWVGVVALYRPFALLALLAFIPAFRPIKVVRSKATGRELIAALAGTGTTLIVLGALLVIGIAL